MTIIDVSAVDLGPCEPVRWGGKRPDEWARVIVVRSADGSLFKLNLYAATPAALATTEAEEYAAEQSATAVCSLAGD